MENNVVVAEEPKERKRKKKRNSVHHVKRDRKTYCLEDREVCEVQGENNVGKTGEQGSCAG